MECHGHRVRTSDQSCSTDSTSTIRRVEKTLLNSAQVQLPDDTRESMQDRVVEEIMQWRGQANVEYIVMHE